MNYILIIVLLLNNNCLINGLERIWTGGNKALHEIEEYNCKGLIFPKEFYPIIILDSSRTVNNIQLPITGLISLGDSTTITFDSSETSCKAIKILNDFANRPNNWDALQNKAVPFLDRLPCPWDDIIIPKTNALGITPFPKVKVNSLRMFDKNISADDIETFLELDLPLNIELSPVKCTKDTCACHQGVSCFALKESYADFDTWPETKNDIYCENGVKPLRSCHRICGAVIISQWVNVDVKLEILELLEKNSKVDYFNGLALTGNVSQIVITDKDVDTGGKYTQEAMILVGETLEKHAKSSNEKVEIVYRKGKNDDVMDLFQEESMYPTFRITVITSGNPIIIGHFFSSGFGLLLITFFINILIFLTIYVLFMTPVKSFFRLNSSPFRPFLFARFDNANDLSDDDDSGRRVDISFRKQPRTNRGNSSSTSSSSSSLSTNTNIVQLEVADQGALERHQSLLTTAIVTSTDRLFDGKQIQEIAEHPHEDNEGNDQASETAARMDDVEKERKVRTRSGKLQKLITMPGGEKEDDIQELTALHDLRNPEGCRTESEKSRDNPEDEGSNDKTDDELQQIRAKQMLKFIEDNLQQVNLLDDQL